MGYHAHIRIARWWERLGAMNMLDIRDNQLSLSSKLDREGQDVSITH
jgi:hypothetical protein